MALSGEEGSYKGMSCEQSQMQKVTEDEQRDPTDWQGRCWWRVNMSRFTCRWGAGWYVVEGREEPTHTGPGNHFLNVFRIVSDSEKK